MSQVLVAMRQLAEREHPHPARDRRESADRPLQSALYLSRDSRDGLTGALQRDSGRTRLQREVERAHAHRGVLAITHLGVVGLRRINDRDGHAAGDAVLVAVGTALVDKLRSCDLVVRWSGDEFVCAMPTTSAAGARRRMEEVRARLAQLHPEADFAIGVAALRRDEDLQSVVDRAEREHCAVRRSEGGDTPS